MATKCAGIDMQDVHDRLLKRRKRDLRTPVTIRGGQSLDKYGNMRLFVLLWKR